ncbi:MAG: PEP-CTERM sorting domain-containing protein [Verrucomicrobia bacterium]|nr:PEP-CTERM sorting domain-containing protein [Verrucomicrobiota bacterium]
MAQRPGGIDNFSVTAIPEPSTYAALFGLLAFVGVMLRRRRA